MKGKAKSIVRRKAEELTIHPLAALLPMLPEESDDRRRIREKLERFGQEHPLQITAGGRIFDGRHQFAEGRALGMEEFQCQVFSDKEVWERIKAAGLCRAHLTKSAKAYWYWPAYSERVREQGGNGNNQHSKEQPCKKCRVADGTAVEAMTMADAAEEIGVSERMLYYAKSAHELFARRPELREEWESLVILGVTPVNKLESAINSSKANKGNDRAPVVYWEVCERGLIGIHNAFKNWDKIPGKKKPKIRALWKAIKNAVPPDIEEADWEDLEPEDAP